MHSSLTSYQLTVSSWMLKRERDDVKPLRDLLVDVPGTGKTVMSIACILGNPPSPDDGDLHGRATLVGVPSLAMGEQWNNMFNNHCKIDRGNSVSPWPR